MPLYALIGGLIIGIIVYLLIVSPNKKDSEEIEKLYKENQEDQERMRKFYSTPHVTNVYHIHEAPKKKKHIDADDIEEG